MVQAPSRVQDRLQLSLLNGISWEGFEALEADFSEVAGYRLAYLDGVVEIKPISNEYEEIKSTLGCLLEVYLRAKGMRFYVRGGPSLGTKADTARRQPDESWQAGNLTLYALRDDGYHQIFASQFVPDLNLAQLVEFASRPDQYDAVSGYTAALASELQ